jgi:hypothetical protein
MNSTTQFSVFTANKPGVLAQICRAMAKDKINITGMSMMDTAESGVLRFTADKIESAREVLHRLNIPMTETDVITATVANRVGAVADLCERLSEARVHVSYLYATSGSRGARTTVVFKVNDAKKAVKAIEGSNKHGTRRDMKIKLRRPVNSRRR